MCQFFSCIKFDGKFSHSIEYHGIRRYSIPWEKFRSKLTQSIGQNLFFHEMKQYHGNSGWMGTVWNLMHAIGTFRIHNTQSGKKNFLAHIIYSVIYKHNRLGTNYFGMFKEETKEAKWY